MNAIECAHTAVDALGLQGTLDVLIEYADAQVEAMTLSKDKLALHRAASDHRLLVNARAKLYN